MNSENFTVFLSMRNIVRKIRIDFDYYNESISAETEERTLGANDDIRGEIAKFYEKNGTKAEKTIQRIIIPERLMNAAVFGISEEGSTRSAKRLAWSKLLNVKQTYSASDAISTADLTGIDYIIISGGYDNSVNNRLNSMIVSLGKNPQLLELKPNIIFAGSRLSLDTARKELAKPGIRFSAQANVLENNRYAEDVELLQQNTLPLLQQMTLWDEIEDVKINDIAYTEALRKISDVFCMKRSETVLSALFTDDYTLLSHAERGAGTTLFRNYAVPQEAGTLTTEVFESVFNDLLIEKQTVFDENFQQKNVLAIDDSVENIMFEPDRIIGVTLTDKIDFEKFIRLVSIPGITHGTIYFLFDDQGIILAGMTMFMQRKGGSNSFLRGFFNTTDIKNGWIFIPYGRFRKGAPAIFIEKLESDRKEDIVLRWGEYRVLEINPDSVVEIHTAKGVFMTKNDPESNKKTIGTKKSRKTLIFDLREEMHKWKQ
ncbi:hypothetical protein IKS86_04165 [bacterium]|nr:hypothetical protein [bacterium]